MTEPKAAVGANSKHSKFLARRLLSARNVDDAQLVGVRRKGDSPEIPGMIVDFDKLDGVGGNSRNGGQLCDDTGGNLNATLIPHQDKRPDQQLTIYLNGSAVPIQVGGACWHREGTFLPILAGHHYGSAEGHATGPTPRRGLPAIDICNGHFVGVVAL